MKIGAIGWYGHQNAGDERIGYCLKRYFEERGHSLTLIKPENNSLSENDLKIINKFDYILYGGGGLVLRNCNIRLPGFSKIKPRFSAIGISVEARHFGNQKFIDLILDKSEFVMVRDERSAGLLSHHNKIITSHDLTFLYPHDIATTITTDICALNLRSWPFWSLEFNSIPDYILRKLDKKFNLEKLQKYYPFSKFNKTELFYTIQASFKQVTNLPFYFEENKNNDIEFTQNLLSTNNKEFNIETMYNSRYIIAMRLHAIIFATQMGIPALNLIYQPKNRGFLEKAGLSELGVDIYEPKDLPKKIAYLKNNYETIQEKMMLYRNKAHNEINEAMDKIYRIVTA